MRIKWFWRSSTGQAPAAPVDLSVAAADADAGGSLHDLASGLIQLAVDRATPDEAMRVLSGLRPRTWLRLDVELRSLRHWFGTDDGWRRITDPARTGSDPLALLLTACFDDGRLRQRAVMTPLMSHDQRLLPILLIRTADWAKQVRDDAVRVLPTALESADTDGVLRGAGLALAMRDWLRGEQAVAAVTEALRTRSDGTLDAARASDDVQLRRLAYRLWLQSGLAESDAVVRAALTERDIICYTMCAEAAVRAAVRDRRPDTLERLLAARFPRIRAEALNGLVQIGQPEAGEDFLADRSTMMRATAQWAMRRASRDAAERYRAMLASGDDFSRRGAVAGLGECGTADDAKLVAGLLRDDRPRVRAEAVRAVRRLGGPLGPVAGMLTDPAPVVVRAVTAALRGRPDLVPVARLWELLGADQPRQLVNVGPFASTDASASVVSECDSLVNDVEDSDTSKRADSGCSSATGGWGEVGHPAQDPRCAPGHRGNGAVRAIAPIRSRCPTAVRSSRWGALGQVQ